MNGKLHLEDVPSIDALWDEWSLLAGKSENLFLTPEWASLWWQHYGRGKKLVLRACRDGDGRLIAILPLYRWRRRPAMLRLLGHGPGDELGPVAAPADRERASACLISALEQERARVLLADHLPGDSDWGRWLAGSRLLRRDGNPSLEFGQESWEEWLRAAKLGRKVRKKEYVLERHFEPRFRLSDGDHLAADIELLFRLHRARWRGRVTSFAGKDEAFQRDFMAVSQQQGWLRLWFLEVDGKAVAAWLGYRYAGAEFGYQAGRDPDYDRFSVGFVLRMHTIRAALEDGMKKYRFLRGAEPYKYRFSNCDDGLLTFAVGRGPVGAAAILGATGLIAGRRALRALTRRG